jgi:hypothetical protein
MGFVGYQKILCRFQKYRLTLMTKKCKKNVIPGFSCVRVQYTWSPCVVGWVDFWTFFTFSTKVPLRFVTYLRKVPKIGGKIFFTH